MTDRDHNDAPMWTNDDLPIKGKDFVYIVIGILFLGMLFT